MERITIFCDGASKGNPGPGGWGAVLSFNETVIELGAAERHTTNNRMELTAAIEGLREAAAHARMPVTVHTDSSYVINGISKWVHGWQKNGWVTKEKKDVINRDLWERLVQAAEALKTDVEWHHVGGHVGVAGNERVDSIASDFAEGKKVMLYRGGKSAYGVDLADLGVDDHKAKAKSSSGTRSKAKAYSYVSLVGGEVVVHKTWPECERRVRGKAARFKKALSPEEEKDIIAAFSRK